jgi:hypothetical protein
MGSMVFKKKKTLLGEQRGVPTHVKEKGVLIHALDNVDVP